MIPEKGYGNPNEKPTGYGCGNHALYYVGDGNGAGDGIDFGFGTGNGKGLNYDFQESAFSFFGNGIGLNYKVFLACGNPTDLKSVVMWSLLFGGK